MHPPVAPRHLSAIVRVLDAVLRSTTRWSVDDPDELIAQVRAGRPAVFVCRHGQLWPVLWAVRGTATQVLVSRSADGELLARLLAGWGFGVCRGSSSRAGFSGARAALRALREGSPVGLAVDGPRGPRGEVQEGGLRLARRAGVPLIPLAVRGGGRWVLRRSWDHFEIPRPFGRLQVRVGPALDVGPDAPGLARAAAGVARALAPEDDGSAPERAPVRTEAAP